MERTGRKCRAIIDRRAGPPFTKTLEISRHRMPSPAPGRESRRSRVRDDHGGVWGSSSQDFLHLVDLLFEKSVEYAKRTDGNCSIYALAGVPLLFSALRCLLIELNAGMHTASPPRQQVLTDLASSPNDIKVILSHYSVPTDLQRRLELLVEVRHEIVHPAHRPGSDKHNTPAYLAPLRSAGLLQSTGSDSDYIWIGQLQSHKLFRWAFETVKLTVEILLTAHGVRGFMGDGLRASYSKYERFDGDL
ncbi:MAG: hypothetical protein HYY78_20620 [Betaproteobacteria bacterium]|nr:hypothetical protein [Betaproteobacteria bacterium]